MSFYRWLRSHLPLTHKGFQNRLNELEREQGQALKQITQEISKTQEINNQLLNQVREAQKELQKGFDNISIDIQKQNELYTSLLDNQKRIEVSSQSLVNQKYQELQSSLLRIEKQNELNGNIAEDTQQSAAELRQYALQSCRHASEAVWAAVFNQCIHGSSWLKDSSFSPGRWAIGYQYLYVLYRILDEVRPSSILELGLGQSTKMIAQYANAFPEVKHQVVEHDPEWISFFKRNYKIPGNTEIVRLPWDFVPYKEAEAVRVYKNFGVQFERQKFDFISIDGPLGGDMKQYARIDVLQLIPNSLSDDFIIMIDDCNRSGEQATVREIEEKLKSSSIPYHLGKYSGDKDTVVIASEKNKFVCSM